MATPDNSTRRLRLVDDNQPGQANDPSVEDLDGQDGELTAKQAAAFAALVAEDNQSAIGYTLEQMTADQLRSLAIALATQVNAAENASGEVADVGPDGLCSIAVASAAQAFGTTRDAVLVMPRGDSQQVKRAVDQLKRSGHAALDRPC